MRMGLAVGETAGAPAEGVSDGILSQHAARVVIGPADIGSSITSTITEGPACGDAFAPIDLGSGGGPTRAAAGRRGGAIQEWFQGSRRCASFGNSDLAGQFRVSPLRIAGLLLTASPRSS